MINLLSHFEQVLIVLVTLDHFMKSLLLSDILNFGYTICFLGLELNLQNFIDQSWYLLSVSHAENVGAEDLKTLLKYAKRQLIQEFYRLMAIGDQTYRIKFNGYYLR